MKKKIFLFVLLISLGLVPIFGQASEAVSQLLEATSITYGQAAYFAATNLSLIPDESSYEQASEEIVKSKILYSIEDCNSPISLAEFSMLCMKTWNFKGGLFYSLFKNPRYAFKEMQSKGIISNESDPDQGVSGIFALNTFTKCIDLAEKGRN